jgi:HNH endonuclease
MSEQKRTRILAQLARYTGKHVPAAFVYRTADFIPEIERFHNLITGIYKPVWSAYALSIVMKLSSPYVHKDEVIFQDGRWLMTYSPRVGGLELSDNRALVKCMDERIPLGVFKQLTDKTSRSYGSTYRVLGLGLITSYDANADVFVVESADQSALEQVVGAIPDEELRYEVRLYAQLTNEFRPFVAEERVEYLVSAPKRDKAFREIVIREYDFTCAVCEMKFRLNDLIEATAAHIVPKQKQGTDDPRNGLALCHTHHWAFDVGIFSLNDGDEVILSPMVERAEKRNFGLLELSGKPILLPGNEGMHPHPVALAWHRDYVWQGLVD